MIKVAVLWLINEKGEVLLAQRSHNKTPDPDIWAPSVTGRLERGETFDQALAREVEEELDLKRADYRPIFLFERDFVHPDGELRKFGIYYAAFPRAKTSSIHLDENEVAAIKWISPEAISKKMDAGTHEFPASSLAIWPDVFRALSV